MIARPPMTIPTLAMIGLALLTALLVIEPGTIARFDAPLSAGLRGFATDRPGLVTVLRIVTDLAATIPFIAAGLAASVLFAARRDRPRALFCIAVTVVVPVGWALGQWLLHRPRPLDGFVTVTANGFPSGHTSNAAAAALAVVLLVWPGVGRTGRLLLCLLAATGVGVIAASRLVLLVHWPVDVIGGCLLAVVVVSLAARWVPQQPGGLALSDSGPGKVSSRDGSCEVRRS
ncbi:phosphatase PAP2 family protein [Micromonospora sp. NBC_01813]|uniref:phosphatase PAP2 family protein n=1 Tax=Micromonospora sp. NBC_01813 TaxID=2975988 RepID=UPI002DDBFEEF|nr:phosphatase PAP2 family protein [Micromonospora sp. NBC_01813]WSA09437.1 phosphatase PAP2 family protein [Micromonospora sp. NBC_01813]